MPQEKLSDAIDLSHHLSHVSQARITSPLKGLQKYFGKPGIISLAGGLPHPDYFPFSSIGGDALASDAFPLELSKESSTLSWFWSIFSGSKGKDTPLHIPKYASRNDDLCLARTLQYSMASGIPQLQKIAKEFTDKVYKPAYANYTTMMHVGNTDGWGKAVLTLCNPGEGVLTAEWTYPSAVSMMLPYGIKAVPVPLDGHGIRSDDLRVILSQWNESARGMPRPHVMYTVPVGQNPTGITTHAARKKEIYDICVEFDIIIVEDDPYYFLQQDPYLSPADRTTQVPPSSDDEEWISQLAPSYLRFDYQGRVVRLDTFSKTVAPGCRLGWFTCNPVFAERLERQSETTSQAPCGFGQTLVASLMLNWRCEGYIRWLKALRVQYQQRRDFFIDRLHAQFHLELSQATVGVWEGCPVYHASFRRGCHEQAGVVTEKCSVDNNTVTVFSFTPPTAGMYIWLKFHFENHPSYNVLDPQSLEMKFWIALAEAGVLFGPGSMFAADKTANERRDDVGHFRISFSNAEYSDMKKAVSIFASVLKSFYEDVSY
ncbi:Aromatic amino acid aminotransferase C56E4.03 [Hypsizygus marmoreus]|uniref:Aromatic amino acid aminotransferase C56E4.03 n=1 Tax=Hypsizygus marmoreus TaxID=39966 RepID=A0A369JN43_HYPMA|nr:Aromatic amino acid aminotransferase C56E4.03 [Hypsizygus marmoreus]